MFRRPPYGRVASSRFNSESSCGGELSSWCTRHGREPDTGHEFSSWPSEQPYISNEFPSGSYVTGATFWPILRGVSSATSSSFAGTTSNKARGQEPGVQTEVREQNSWWGLVVDLGQALGIRAAALWHLRSRPRVEDWELQVEFEHLPEQLLVGEGYLEPTIGAGDEERAAFRAVMMENSRRRDESLSQYASRRTRLHQGRYVWHCCYPGAVTALLQGRDGTSDHVATMLARMDIRSHRITAFAEDPQHYESTSTYLAGGVEEESEGEATPEEVLGDENVLSELAALDFSERSRLRLSSRSWRAGCHIVGAHGKRTSGSTLTCGWTGPASQRQRLQRHWLSWSSSGSWEPDRSLQGSAEEALQVSSLRATWTS